MKKINISFVWQIIILLLLISVIANAEIQGINGIAVKKDSITWSSVQDGYVGDNLTSGVLVSGTYFSDGAGNFSRVRGSIANGLQVDVTRVQGALNVTTISAVNATLIGSSNVVILGAVNVSTSAAGTNAYAIKITNLSAATNYSFGFTSTKVIVQAPSSNTEDICINWQGQTAVCPATNTAGADRLAPGTAISLDNYATTSISAASNSGTQMIFIRSFK